MESAERQKLEQKRDELIIELVEKGYTPKQLRVIFNKHPQDIEEILEENGYGLIYKD